MLATFLTGIHGNQVFSLLVQLSKTGISIYVSIHWAHISEPLSTVTGETRQWLLLCSGKALSDGMVLETYRDPCEHLRGKHSKQETEKPTPCRRDTAGTVRKNKAGSMGTAERAGWLTTFISSQASTVEDHIASRGYKSLVFWIIREVLKIKKKYNKINYILKIHYCLKKIMAEEKGNSKKAGGTEDRLVSNEND